MKAFSDQMKQVFRYLKKKKDNKRSGRKTFLIWGANFNNKGAQAMLFTAVSELRIRFPGCRILFNTYDQTPKGYQFERVFLDQTEQQLLMRNPIYWYFRCIGVLLIRHRFDLAWYYRLRDQFKSVDALIDISGYALSSQWEYSSSDSYLKIIDLAKLYHIPVFLMPQSFGPFEYGDRQAELDRRLSNTLQYPVVIYARENTGFIDLTEKYHLKNVKRSVDLVLQNKGIKESLVRNKKGEEQLTSPVTTKKNVAIIPNMRNVDRGGANQERLIAAYVRCINELVLNGFHVYLMRHSGEDLAACQGVYSALSDTHNVFLLVDDYDCIQFNDLLPQFCFVIGSRYHSIVHAYKNGVPAVALGWAEKYRELLSLFHQEKYQLDVRTIDSKFEGRLLSAVQKMEKSYEAEQHLIRKLLPMYQIDNCFDAISTFFEKKS